MRLSTGFLAVPLLVEAVSLGAFSLGYNETPERADIDYLEAVAGQVAQTLVRVRLSERDRQRRVELEFLADLTEAALRATDHESLMADVASAAVPTLGDWCSIHFAPEDGGDLHVALAHVNPQRVAWARELQERYPFDPDAETGVAAVMRSGVTDFIPHVTDAVLDEAIEQSAIAEPDVRSILEELALTSVITVPMVTRRRMVGAMQFVTAESGRLYTSDDVALAEAVGGRMAELLDNAWSADQQRSIAVSLQTALLPPKIPTIPGVDVAARYLPAGTSVVGGDFYDVFAIEARSWALLIGDACGTGPNAAALTSIARHTVRAAARHGFDAPIVIDWLNEAIAQSDRGLFCTACYATLSYDGEAWALKTAAAGHPLPIVLRRGRATAVGRPGTLLGMFDDVNISVTDTVLEPGDVVIFYTDGVTDLPPPNGLTPEEMAQLIESLALRASASDMADGIHESIVRRVPERERRDDVAMLVLRVCP